jgi:hypothetical protein
MIIPFGRLSPLRLSPWLAELTSWPANEAITGEVLIPHSGQGHGKDEAGSTLVTLDLIANADVTSWFYQSISNVVLCTGDPIFCNSASMSPNA